MFIPDTAIKFPKAWKAYELGELGQWVHLLTKRAMFRTNQADKDSDIGEAQGFLNQMQEHVAYVKSLPVGGFPETTKS